MKRNSMQRNKCRSTASRALGALVVLTLTILMLVPGSWALKYRTLYGSTNSRYGSTPYAGLILDQAGNLYGTAGAGGVYGYGTIFELSPAGNGGWKGKLLHSFNGKDGTQPNADLILDAQGNLYGTTIFGGEGDCSGLGCGVVFELIPMPDGTWQETVLHYFSGTTGVNPACSLVFDAAGNLYGTTADWSYRFTGPGTVFKLASLDGTWTLRTLYTFGGSDGYNPSDGLIFDPAGNLYGTTDWGGAHDQGVVFELTPQLDGTWVESVLHNFRGGSDGHRPQVRPIRDSAGNLYGVTTWGGARGYGTIWKLAPNPDGSWTKSTLYSFADGNDGGDPWGTSLALDATGNLYGTTHDGGKYACGVVFQLTPTLNGPWKETVIHSFADPPGCGSFSSVIFDNAGNLYGTTTGDGTTTFGSAFEIAP